MNPTHKAKDINLLEIFLVLKRRIWILVAAVFLASIVGLLLNSLSSVPLYQSSTKIIIYADPEGQKTLKVIIRDSSVLDKVIEKLGLNETAESLAGKINVSSVDGTQVVSISVIYSESNMAAKIADTTADEFIKKVPEYSNDDHVLKLSKAKVRDVPINPKSNNKLYLAIIGGFVAGFGLIFFLESLDDKIRSKNDIELFLELPVLGEVSKVNKRSVKRKTNKIQLDVRGETIGYK